MGEWVGVMGFVVVGIRNGIWWCSMPCVCVSMLLGGVVFWHDRVGMRGG